jgi:hypothetical protein
MWYQQQIHLKKSFDHSRAMYPILVGFVAGGALASMLVLLRYCMANKPAKYVPDKDIAGLKLNKD